MSRGAKEYPHRLTIHLNNDDMETALTARQEYGTPRGRFVRRAYQLGKKAALDEAQREAERTAAIAAQTVGA